MSSQEQIDTGRRERKRRATRAHLLSEASKLFAAQGFWATRVEQIAAAADVAPATFFNYFPTKAAVLKAMARDMFEALTASALAQCTQPASTRERLTAFFTEAQAIVETWKGRLPETLLMMVRVIALSSEGREEMERLLRAFSALIYDGQVQGDVRSDADAAFLADMARAAFVAVLLNWLNDPRFPLATRMQQAASFVIDALGASNQTPQRRSS